MFNFRKLSDNLIHAIVTLGIYSIYVRLSSKRAGSHLEDVTTVGLTSSQRRHGRRRNTREKKYKYNNR